MMGRSSQKERNPDERPSHPKIEDKGMTKLLVLITLMASAAGAEPAKAKTPATPTLPVIEIRASTTPLAPESKPGTIELPAIQGQVVEKMTIRNRYGRFVPYGLYGMPAGPGRAWPDAAPPGAPGPAGMYPAYP